MIKHALAAGALGLGLLGAAGAAAQQQRDATGMPMAEYCNTVPNLSVKRGDAVDTWVALCTVWFRAHRDKPQSPPKDAAKPEKN